MRPVSAFGQSLNQSGQFSRLVRSSRAGVGHPGQGMGRSSRELVWLAGQVGLVTLGRSVNSRSPIVTVWRVGASGQQVRAVGQQIRSVWSCGQVGSVPLFDSQSNRRSAVNCEVGYAARSPGQSWVAHITASAKQLGSVPLFDFQSPRRRVVVKSARSVMKSRRSFGYQASVRSGVLAARGLRPAAPQPAECAARGPARGSRPAARGRASAHKSAYAP